MLQPDIVFIGEARRRIVTQIGIFESPGLVVEILSPSTEKRDRVTKRQLYAKHGIQELWLVDTETRTIEVFRSHDGRLEEVEMVSGDGKLTSPLLPGVGVTVSGLFGA